MILRSQKRRKEGIKAEASWIEGLKSKTEASSTPQEQQDTPRNPLQQVYVAVRSAFDIKREGGEEDTATKQQLTEAMGEDMMSPMEDSDDEPDDIKQEDAAKNDALGTYT